MPKSQSKMLPKMKNDAEKGLECVRLPATDSENMHKFGLNLPCGQLKQRWKDAEITSGKLTKYAQYQSKYRRKDEKKMMRRSECMGLPPENAPNMHNSP
jgi:hypothetical protein